jgi:hypothetical protein
LADLRATRALPKAAVAIVSDGRPSIARDIDSYLESTGFGE